ncbi:MAG: hypothetical protein RLO06_08830 [Parvibaculum sp.]|jgi:hypothetical protein
MRDELETVREWADAKIKAGEEPPWAWFQYMKLRETLDQILAGMDATVTLQDSPESPDSSEKHLRLVGDSDQQDSAQRHSAGLPVHLPT